MPTVFPGSNDVFIEPSTPESTALNSAGSGTRNHNEHHRDMGDAIEELEKRATLPEHDHSGVPTGPGGRVTGKLKQANTHEDVDTDKAATSIHHSLGTGEFQAAPGNHKHKQSDITDLANYICTSTTRPTNPKIGTMIFETDLNTVRVWTKWRAETTARWVLLPVANVPICRLLQGTEQRILSSGSTMEWRVEEEDSFGMFNAATSMTDIVIPEAGLYSIDASVAWSPDRLFGDNAYTRILINGAPTTRVHGEFVRGGGLFTPGFPQSVDVTAKVRFEKNDRLAIRASHNGALSSWTLFGSTATKQDSRIDVAYLSP